MRWPWVPSEGMVRISDRRLIELLRTALHVAELEQESAAARARTASLVAERRAHDLLVKGAVGGVRPEMPVELPLTAAGRLHEEAFMALVDARVWERRERQLREWQEAT